MGGGGGGGGYFLELHISSFIWSAIQAILGDQSLSDFICLRTYVYLRPQSLGDTTGHIYMSLEEKGLRKDLKNVKYRAYSKMATILTFFCSYSSYLVVKLKNQENVQPSTR